MLHQTLAVSGSDVPILSSLLKTPGDYPEDRSMNALVWTSKGARRKGWITTVPAFEVGIQALAGLEEGHVLVSNPVGIQAAGMAFEYLEFYH